MNNQKFFICRQCGNLVGFINNTGVPLNCCGEDMEELVANTTEASEEKHIPEVTVEGDMITVQVGSVLHPMTEEHHIEFIFIQSANGGQRKALKAGDKPTATFKLVDDSLLEVFAYCNLHGLWKYDAATVTMDEAVCSAEFTKECE